MTFKRSVAVFCGSKTGNHPVYAAAAQDLGQGLARAKVRLVYGGGRIGLMGELADAVLAAGGQVLGVIPQFLTYFEVAHPELNDLVITDSMHSRKRHMFDASDAFVMLPGAVGTFDETIEVITWKQLGQHNKPILIANIGGSADAFIALLEDAIHRGFMTPANRQLYEVYPDIPSLLRRIEHIPPDTSRISDRF
jgi:uncharacterized protein (TIGR00730 family)